MQISSYYTRTTFEEIKRLLEVKVQDYSKNFI